MWSSSPTTHVYSGRGQRHRCVRCMEELQEGQKYNRWVWRPGIGRRLYVEVEHLNSYDCPEEEFEAVHQPVEVSVTVSMEMVVKTRLVELVTLFGETVYESETYIDTVTSEPNYEHLNQNPEDDGEDVPF